VGQNVAGNDGFVDYKIDDILDLRRVLPMLA